MGPYDARGSSGWLPSRLRSQRVVVEAISRWDWSGLGPVGEARIRKHVWFLSINRRGVA